MKSKKMKFNQLAQFYPYIILVFTVIFLQPSVTSQVNFNQNSEDSCIIEYHVGKDSEGYIINGNKDEVFNRMNDKYFVSNERISFSCKNDVTVFKLSKYELKDSKRRIFIDNREVGVTEKDDIIILYYDKKVDAYDRKKVKVSGTPTCKK